MSSAMDSSSSAATSRPSFAATTDTSTATRTGYGYGNGKLLDLADLDGYLLSLLSTDLAEACKYALMAKENIFGAVGSNSENNENSNPEAASHSSTFVPWRWQWEDFLAVATIWASRGQTPGARALGFHLVETTIETTTTPNSSRQSSFWWWLLGAIRGGNINSNRSNNNNNIFRNKIAVYAILRVILPRLYERLKSKGLEYANREEPFGGDATENEEKQHERPISLRLQPPPKPMPQRDDDGGFGCDDGDGNDDKTSREPPYIVPKPPCAEATKANEKAEAAVAAATIRAIALQRRKIVVKTVVRWLDGMILPSMRLALVVSCWTGHDRGHGGNLALWWSGLSYELSQPPPPTTTNNKNTTTANNNNNTMTANTLTATTTLPLFVLYAHRRWFHKEAMELLWNQVGRGLLVLHGEISELSSSVSSALVIEWRTKVLRWSYQLDRLSRKIQGIDITSHVGGQTNNHPNNENDAGFTDKQNESCILCGTNEVVVPYRLVECCGKVVCYVCLWERLASTTSMTRKRTTMEAAPAVTVLCPVCCQDIQRCEPV
jgi:hypothetical protein